MGAQTFPLCVVGHAGRNGVAVAWELCPVVRGDAGNGGMGKKFGVGGKGVTTYDLPGVYINVRIKHASPLNLFLSFQHCSRWDLSMYMSLYTFYNRGSPPAAHLALWGGV